MNVQTRNRRSEGRRVCFSTRDDVCDFPADLSEDDAGFIKVSLEK